MYKIEITAETLAELAGKAMSLAAKLNTGTATEAVAKGAAPVKTVEVAPEVAEQAPVDPTPTPTAPAVGEQASSPSSAVPTDAPAAPTAELDFDTDIAPLVLQVVKDKGKPVAQEILSQFGVEKASNLDPARWPELVVALQDAL